MKKRVLITGGAGFIAHHTIKHILNHTDWEIVSLDRLDYTVLGNGVNLASRLESSANSNEILISENTYNLIKKEINFKYFDEIRVKGRAHLIKTFQVIGIKSNQKVQSQIKASEEGFKLFIDRKKIKDLDGVVTLLEDSIEKLIN